MRRAAGEGLAGIEGADRELFPDRFMFMARVEEAGRDRPTVLASITDAGWGACLTRTGVKALDHGEVLHWERYDILDRVTGQWGMRCPFREWEQGGLVYELCNDDIVVMLADVPILGDWNSTEGAFAFFTSEERAEHYRDHHLGNGRNRMLFLGSGALNDPQEAMAAIHPRQVPDLRVRLVELATVNPVAAWCLNPDDHRENTACGRLPLGGNRPVGAGQGQDEVPKLAAVSGIWDVLPGNVFELAEPIAPWTGRDTIRWSGGQSLQLQPLDRSFIAQAQPIATDLDDLTDSEAEEVVTRLIESVELESSWNRLNNAADQIDNPLDQFTIVCWDTVTGDGADFPWRFPSFIAALGHLAAYEREYDSGYRTDGAQSCSHVGFAGSGDGESEDLRSWRFRLGLRRLALRALRSRYRPADAADLVALCNGTLRTLHVEFAGFVKDLLWASTAEQQMTLLEHLDIDEGTWVAWSQSADPIVDEAGAQLAVDRLGAHAWEGLHANTRHFLATALLALSEQGHAPQLDYAPISLELVKALEVELGSIFEEYRRKLSDDVPEPQLDSGEEKSLVVFLEGGRPPTLGPMSYLLRNPGDRGSELAISLHGYLCELQNYAFLTSGAFAKRGLQRVLNKYRNGGVHDAPISEDVCRECVDVVVGTLTEPGFIPRVAVWRELRAGST
jgi:hypothetical protein